MIDKLDMTSPDLVSQNIQNIAQLFPNCVTETANGLAIDFDMLKQELSNEIVEGNKERYRLEWPGKREAIVTANLPINKTLRPVREESVDFDNTQNLYIEGDNLEVLKLLQESYLGKIKMIYIDPPYNTGKDFVYKDNFTQDSEEYQEEAGLKDEYNNRLLANPDTSGRYHSDWLTMMYPRLKLARNLLTDDGVIFISIDDNEVHNLRKVCDEVFGEGNFLTNIIWQHSIQPKGYSGKFSVHHNYTLCYQKSDSFELNSMERTDEHNTSYSNPDNDPKGLWRTGDVRNALYRPNLIYDIITPSGKKISPSKNGWRWSKETVKTKIETGEIIFSADETRIIRKIYLSNLNGRTPETIWFGKDTGTTRDASKELKELFNDNSPFDTPKPTTLIKKLIELNYTTKNDIVLDFFSGSATTAHSVIKLNAEDGGNRKYIMVQVPEKTDEKSEAFKAGYDTICEIGKERIRRAAKKIKEETKADIDYGFRVYKLDSSNMQDVYYTPKDFTQDLLSELEDNIKPDRTADDLVAQIMLDWGLPLSLKIEKTIIANKEVFKVADDALFCCFDGGIDEAFAKEIATLKPLRIVFRDKSFKDDTAKENVKQLLKQLSPESEMRVI